MATLREYFETDFPALMNAGSTLTLTVKNGAGGESTTYEIPAPVHYDFDSGTKYISYLVLSGPDTFELCEVLFMHREALLEAVKGVLVQSGYPGESMRSSLDLRFSGRIFLYTEDMLTPAQMGRLELMAKEQEISLIARTPITAQERSKLEKPLAFISHDSRDKADFARPIALGLSKMRCPVWYDEYSLKAGTSLRASIEKG